MKIAFLSTSISRAFGGIFEIERRLAQSLAGPDTSVEFFAPSDSQTLSDLPSWVPLRPHHFPCVGPSSFRYSPQLKRAFLSMDANLVHVHGLWTYNSILAPRWARHWKRPYVITAHGMLDPWAVRNSGWKKRIVLSLYERQFLKGAACIQVNSEAELRSVREFGLSNPVCIIPNGMDLPDENSLQMVTVPWAEKVAQERKVLLYLGRLHPKKGLVNLLKAWAQKKEEEAASQKPSWVLAIAGWDQGGHEAELKELCRREKMEESVVFLGPKFGEEKAACYRNCDAFILPSFSEGLPMVILEAWAYGKPVLMTPECNLPEGFAASAALRVEAQSESVANGLGRLFAMSDDERGQVGQQGLMLVKDRFHWPKVAAEMRLVYEWILGRAAKPECVITGSSR